MKHKVITDKEIKDCIKLLHKDYHDAKMHVFDTFFDFLKWVVRNKFTDFSYIKKVYKGRTVGCYNSGRNQIHIYIFNDKSEERYRRINIIHTVMHEIRHYYQYNYKGYKWNDNVRYELGDYRYKSAAEERDANKFAARMMMKNKDKISNILNVYPCWSVRGYEY